MSVTCMTTNTARRADRTEPDDELIDEAERNGWSWMFDYYSVD